MSFDRKRLVECIVHATREMATVLALWEDGSESFGRTDGYSDIDLEVVVETGHIGTVATAVKAALAEIVTISGECRQHDNEVEAQYFWQLDAVPAYNFIDITLMERNGDGIRIDPSVVGSPIIHFDKCGCIVVSAESAEERQSRVRDRIREIAGVFMLGPVLVEKHIKRGHVLHAYGEYQRSQVRPLIDLLRARYCPERSSWQTTYIESDLPGFVLEKLGPLVLVASAEEMSANLPIIQTWMTELIDELNAG